MYKAKTKQKPKSYWEMLIKEVTSDNQHKKTSDTTKGILYEVHNERKTTKYVLGEPLTSTYFTQREAECVIQMLEGKTMNETGEILKLSPRTVEYYLGRIKKKLNCRKKSDLIKLVSQTDFAKNFAKNPHNQR